MTEEQVAKLRSELDVVQTNAQVLGEMLITLQPGEEHPQDLDLLLVKNFFQIQLFTLLKKTDENLCLILYTSSSVLTENTSKVIKTRYEYFLQSVY